VARVTCCDCWQGEGWEGLLKRGEMDMLVKSVKTVAGWLKTGMESFIKVAAESAARALLPG